MSLSLFFVFFFVKHLPIEFFLLVGCFAFLPLVGCGSGVIELFLFDPGDFSLVLIVVVFDEMFDVLEELHGLPSGLLAGEVLPLDQVEDLSAEDLPADDLLDLIQNAVAHRSIYHSLIYPFYVYCTYNATSKSVFLNISRLIANRVLFVIAYLWKTI